VAERNYVLGVYKMVNEHPHFASQLRLPIFVPKLSWTKYMAKRKTKTKFQEDEIFPHVMGKWFLTDWHEDGTGAVWIHVVFGQKIVCHLLVFVILIFQLSTNVGSLLAIITFSSKCFL
jgi:hypothetical protein